MFKVRILIVLLALILAGCNTTKKESPKVSNKSYGKCSIVGVYNWKKSHPRLTTNLCKMSRIYGTITVTSSCRSHKGNRGTKKSYHLYSRGCKAVDLYIKGVKNSTLIRWWARNVGGGRGTYRCRRFIHLDVGPNRTWHWKTKCKRRRK